MLCFLFVKEMQVDGEQGGRKSNKLQKKKKLQVRYVSKLKCKVISHLFQRSIRRGKKSVFICNKYQFCLGSSSPETAGLLLLDALREMRSS